MEKSTLDKILSILENQTTEDKYFTTTTTEETTADSYQSTVTETEKNEVDNNFRTTEREVIELEEILTTATENVEKTTVIEEEEETTFPWMDLEKDNEITTAQQINQIKSTENPNILDIILNTEDTRILDKFLQTLQTTTDLTTTELEFKTTEQEEEKLTTIKDFEDTSFLATTQKILNNPTTIDQRIPTTNIPLKETTLFFQEETTAAETLIEETSFIDWEKFFEEDPQNLNMTEENNNSIVDQDQIFTTSTAIRFITEELELAQQIYEISTTSFPDFATSESNRKFFNEATTDGNWFVDTTAVGQWE